MAETKNAPTIIVDALASQAGLAEMLELLLVLGWHNLQSHNYLPNHELVVLEV